MREILFRAAQKVDGSKSLHWYEGSLVSEKDGYTGEVEYYIENENGSFLVIPSTVGQYTGLTDKNGNKIFEGDILDVAYDIYYVGISAERIGAFIVVFENGCFMKRNEKGLFHFIPSDKCKVIGNIHDNSELLKGGRARMTDTEIIKALECCTTKGAKCSDCPAFKKVDRSNCKKYFRGAINLINRQQAEIERLNKKVEELSDVLSDTIKIRYAEAKAEAYKEFAEHLKEEWFNNYYDSPDVDFDEFVDNLLKEILGEE